VGLDEPGAFHLAGDTVTGNIFIRTKIKPSEINAETLSLSLLGIEKYQKISSNKTKITSKIVDI
jgi:hypothetical protein